MSIEQSPHDRPFVMRFEERVEGEEVAQIPGQYNPKLQVWEYNDTLSASFPIASFPKVEKPPTVSTVITAPPGRGQLPKTDMGPDD